MAAAVAVTVVAAPVGAWAALFALATIISQLHAGFGVIINANWFNLFNPAVWFGFNNIAGTSSIGDSLVAGPGTPGDSVNRYILFMVAGILAAACFAAMKAAWMWLAVRIPTSEHWSRFTALTDPGLQITSRCSELCLKGQQTRQTLITMIPR